MKITKKTRALFKVFKIFFIFFIFAWAVSSTLEDPVEKESFGLRSWETKKMQDYPQAIDRTKWFAQIKSTEDTLSKTQLPVPVKK